MHSYIPFIVGAFLATAVRGSASSSGDHSVLPHHLTCKPSNAGGCASCGANYVQCGPDTCYNPSAGEVCCSSQYSCPAGATCSSTGTGCIPKHNSRRDADCSDDDQDYGTSMNMVSTSSNPTSVSITSDSTTSYTTTVTSTTTSTVTVSATSSSADACSLSAATTGLPLTTSMAPFGNATTVALDTTTSTLSVTNVSTTAPASISVPINATVATQSIVPPITGYTGAATDLQGQSSTSLFALGSLVFMATLLI
ncbi:uncharacterized protein Z520_03510 [Fonsecaea multimorphosa CBS 102226]|uniref:Uncharacterized protein n=1 Tax=Fonsecaea multimorphosa CBS 102226 TaxID=1442371 RepID=A0A0D2KVR8_9EURO|nr:uncharacterized protein Z520_03510 [Fonsecaea multimorphosa CBS 102226]KIY00844.1 hypothetical protein Z520_03510 [Fonsecaea multimorphosa CBS 102226]